MNNIDPIKHFEEISDNLKQLRGVVQETTSNSDLNSLKNDLLKAEFIAYKLKLEISIDELQKDQYELSVRDVVVKLTPELRPDISPELIPVLVKFIIEEWNLRRPRKVA